jgi:hypothetical protein
MLTVGRCGAARAAVAAIRPGNWPVIPAAVVRSRLVSQACTGTIGRPAVSQAGWPAQRVSVCCRQRVRPHRAELAQPVLSLAIGAVVRRLAIIPPPAHNDLHTDTGNTASAHREPAFPVRSDPSPIG